MVLTGDSVGLVDTIKEIYYNAEEKYYNFLDKLNKSIPVYEIVDPIDKVIPSFILVIGLFFLILALVAITIIAIVFPMGANDVTVIVQNADGDRIDGASVIIFRNDNLELESETNAQGIVKAQGISIDDQLEIRVEAQDYLSDTKFIFVDELPLAVNVTLEEESAAFTTKTVRLYDSLGPVSGNFTLEFSCSNPYAPSISDITVKPSDGGIAKVQVPNNCQTLSVNVLDTASFSEVYGEVVSGEDHIIYLSEESTAKGTISINVSDALGGIIDGIEIELYKNSELIQNPDIGPINVDFTSGGTADFSVTPGDYVVKAYDSAGRYGEQSSGRITVASGETKNVSMTLSENIRGQIKVKVVDKKSQALVENANVKLFIAATDEQITAIRTDEKGEAVFNISRDVEYNIVVSADSYQIGRLGGLRIGENFKVVELNKCTPTTCGSLKVKVVDQDNIAIDNATVFLYDASTNFVAGYDSVMTDINGIATFRGVSSGNYFAFAFREGFSGRSDAGSFSSSVLEDTGVHLTVTMEIGSGIVRVNVKDKEGRAVSFPEVLIVDARTNESLGRDIGNVDGVYEKELKANRKVYIIVNKEDEQIFARYATVKKPIIVGSVQEFNVILEKPILKDNVEIEFLGLYKDGARAQNVKAGDTYKAKFKLRIPEEKDYDEAGVHIRLGEDVIMEKDKLFIKEVNAPRTSQVRATRFESEASGIATDEYETTVDDAKWVNLVWQSPNAGIYEIEAEVEIKNSAALGEKLLMNYRAWGELDGDRDRFPVDNTVTEELYSTTKEEVFQVGIVTLCDENFCFTSSITDEENDLVQAVTDTYSARVFNPYRMTFVITNNSDSTIHNNANLRIKNFDQSLKFFEYKFIDSQSTPKEGVVNGFEFERLNAGNLSPKNSIRMDSVDFVPQKAGNGIISMQIVSDQRVVFEKTLTIVISSPRELKAEINPQVYLSGIHQDINVLVTDSANGLEVQNAIVRLKDKRENILAFDTTDVAGRAFLILPGQKPGEKLKLEIEKINYNIKVIELEVSDKLLEINPEQLGVSLNVKTKVESEEKFSVRNVAPYDLRVKNIELTGKFKNILDKAKIKAWLDNSYKNMILKSNDSQEIILKTYLSEAAANLSDRAAFDGELIITASNFGHDWVFKVPTKISVGLGGEVDNPACLIVTRKDWTASTTGTPKRIEFEIQNNCTVNGKPVALQDLEAKVDWKTNQLGEFVLNIGPDETILRSGYFRLLLGTLQKEQTLTAILSFTPYGGVNGISEADVVIEASNPLDNEKQILQNTIATKISSVNLDQCLSYDKEIITVKQGESGAFTITANDICNEPVEFEIESDLVTSPRKSFKIQPGQSQTLEVFAEQNDPGQYGVFISPKFTSAKREQLVKNLRVRINADGCWQLSRYEFDVYDSPSYEFDGFDTTTITNTCVEKQVPVEVNAKDITQAATDGLAWGALAFLISGLRNTTDPEVNFWGSAQDPKQDKGGPSAISVSAGEYYKKDGKWYKTEFFGDTQIKDKQAFDYLDKTSNGSAEINIPTDIKTKELSTTGKLILPITGYLGAITGGGGAAAGAGGLVNGLIKNVLGTNPIASGLLGFVVGTFLEYQSQDETVTFTVFAKDAEIKDVTLVQGAAGTEKEDPDIELTVEGLGDEQGEATVPQPLTNNPDLISQGVNTIRAIFTNITGFTTTDEQPKYSTLKVEGIRHKYKDKVYDKDDFLKDEGGILGFFQNTVIDKDKDNLDDEKPQDLEQRYRLEFNSVPPQTEQVQPLGLLNCQDGTRVGSTGSDALPKVKFDWSWSGIKEDTCNEDNANGIYCDGTQFTIALMKKIHELDNFVSSAGASFSCPSPEDALKTENIIDTHDVGIKSVSTSKQGRNVEVIAVLKNTNPGIIETDVQISILNQSNNSTTDCAEGMQKVSLAAGSERTVTCTFEELDDGFYDATVDIVPNITCEECQDAIATNTLSKKFYAGTTGLEQCEPYSTERLDSFLQASGISNNAMVNRTRFDARLMVDGYSTDFQRDFDVAQNLSFFSAPDYYTDELSGLGVYFKNSDLFAFDAYSQPDYIIPGPGTYNIVVDITYNDDSWQLFDEEGNPNAKINIRMEKLDAAEPDSPFYYLPFDGKVGLDGRTGYGINYAGDPLIINNTSQGVRTVEIAGSAPIENGTLRVTKDKSFRQMQVDEKGVVMKLSTASGEPTLTFRPSNATPVIMQIDKQTNGDAYAVYQIGVDGDAVDAGQTMALWNGIGASCRAFDGQVMAQQQFVPDSHGINARCALVGANERSKYALEFCDDPIEFGSVFYETVFYTPQDSDSYLQLIDVASDNAKLIGATVSGTKTPLNGNGITSDISTVEDVFDLVSDEYLCVSGTSINAEFFWNPKKIFATIENNEEQAINACISG